MSLEIGLSNPFNYTGSKHRYLSDLSEILPTSDNLTVIDAFVGGGDLCSHLNKTWAVDAVDSCSQLIEMHKAVQTGLLTVDATQSAIERGKMDRYCKQSYYNFRDSYNANQCPVDLYALITHANTNRMRFSAEKDEFNMSSGVPYRWFNNELQNKLIDYANRLRERDIIFCNQSAFDFDFSQYDVALIDPPYFGTTATYNEKGGWTKQQEIELIEKINRECKKGAFVYFGQTWSKGVENKEIAGFAAQHDFRVLKSKKNVSHNRKGGLTVDVMIYSKRN